MRYDKDSLLSMLVLGNPGRVREAIAADANVNAREKDRHNWTPLHKCTHPKSVRLLIAAEANVNARDKNGWTPLHMAETPEVAIALLEAGADWTIKENNGRTAAELDRQVTTGVVADAIERWVAAKPARERAVSLNENLEVSEEQRGPEL